MEAVTIALAAVAGLFSNWFVNVVKHWLSGIKEFRQFEVIGPTGEKMKISVDASHQIDPITIKAAILRHMLQDPKYKFGRDFERLKAAIASNDAETEHLLLQIGARHNVKLEGKDTWTLQPL